jgi:hypothetical protein
VKLVVALALLSIAVPTAASAAPQGRSWKWCHVRPSNVSFREVCSSGHVIFTWLDALFEQSGYRSFITGFRQTGSRSGIVDTRGDGYIHDFDPFDCASNDPPPPEDCVYRDVAVRARYATRDGGRHWLPVRAHRRVSITYGHDGTPQYWDFDVAPRPCSWRHVQGHEEVDGVGGRFGNYCSPNRLWIIEPNP